MPNDINNVIPTHHALVPVNVNQVINTPSLKWAGEGIDITNGIEQALIDAGLNWSTIKRPMLIAHAMDDVLKGDTGFGEGLLVPEHYALLRSDNAKLLDVVGKRYKPIHNLEAFKVMEDFLNAGDATLHSLGSFKEGKYVWGLAKLKQEITLPNGKTVGYMMLSNPHVTGASFVMKLVTKCIPCWNTYQAALNLKGVPEFRMTHRSDFSEQRFNTIAKTTLERANESLLDYEAQSVRLLNHTLTIDNAMPILAEVYNVTEEQLKEGKSRTLNNIREAYDIMPNKTGPNALDVFNAVTYYNTHEQGRNDQGRFFNQTLGVQATQATKVFDKLLDLTAKR